MGDVSRGEIALKFTRLLLSFIISSALLWYLVPLIFNPDIDDGLKKWLTGLIGMMIGYWVK